MNLKNKLKAITNYFGKKSDDEKEEKVTKVIFNDSNLHITIGQWLELLPNTKVSYLRGGGTVYSSMNAEELLKIKRVKQKDLEKVDKTFGKLLTSIGIDVDEICSFDNFDEDELSFSCYFSKKDDEAKMAIRYGAFLDCGPALIMDYKGKKTSYDYIYPNDERDASLKLNYYTLNLDDTGKRFTYYNSEYGYYGDVYNDDYKLELEIAYPESIEEQETNPYLDEEKLKEILTSCSFPIQIDELCRKICEASFKDIRVYPKIKISFSKRNKEAKNDIIDYAEFKNGEFTKYIVTKNGKTISIDNFDNWTYSSLKFKISKNSDDQVSYEFTQMPQDSLKEFNTPTEQLQQVSEEIEEVKKLALSLFI